MPRRSMSLDRTPMYLELVVGWALGYKALGLYALRVGFVGATG